MVGLSHVQWGQSPRTLIFDWLNGLNGLNGLKVQNLNEMLQNPHFVISAIIIWKISL